MTDKQIIIDGVNVSGCECYNPNIKMDCLLYPLQPDACKNNPNCYYKQLKRKEQECEALQMSENETGEIIAELKAYKDINEDFKTAWEELKAENEELKKIINEAKSSNLDLKSFLVGEAVGKEYEQQLDQLKQTLTEIKEICNSVENIENINSLYDAKLSGMFLQANKILKKISEVVE